MGTISHSHFLYTRLSSFKALLSRYERSKKCPTNFLKQRSLRRVFCASIKSGCLYLQVVPSRAPSAWVRRRESARHVPTQPPCSRTASVFLTAARLSTVRMASVTVSTAATSC